MNDDKSPFPIYVPHARFASLQTSKHQLHRKSPLTVKCLSSWRYTGLCMLATILQTPRGTSCDEILATSNKSNTLNRTRSSRVFSKSASIAPSLDWNSGHDDASKRRNSQHTDSVQMKTPQRRMPASRRVLLRTSWISSKGRQKLP